MLYENIRGDGVGGKLEGELGGDMGWGVGGVRCRENRTWEVRIVIDLAVAMQEAVLSVMDDPTTSATYVVLRWALFMAVLDVFCMNRCLPY